MVRHSDLREVDRGDWLGKTEMEVGAVAIERWNRGPDFCPPGGGEALATGERYK